MMMYIDPRGPMRTVTATANDPRCWYLTLDCGHVSEHTSHYWFEVGEEVHCLACKDGLS